MGGGEAFLIEIGFVVVQNLDMVLKSMRLTFELLNCISGSYSKFLKE